MTFGNGAVKSITLTLLYRCRKLGLPPRRASIDGLANHRWSIDTSRAFDDERRIRSWKTTKNFPG